MPEGWGRTFRTDDRKALFELLKDYPQTLSLSAHTHLQRIEFMGADDDWDGPKPHIHYNVGTTSGDWWSGVPGKEGVPPTTMRDGTPNGFASIHFEGNDFELNYTAAGDSGRASSKAKMSHWGPELVPQDSWHGAQLYVNYFLGTDSTDVEFRLKGRKQKWRSMQKVDEADPHISALRYRWDTSRPLLSGRRPSNPVPSTHLWKTGVPNNLPLGEQTIEIRVKDMFGRTFTDEFIYEVVEPRRISEDQ
jgi:hypothetical protein